MPSVYIGQNAGKDAGGMFRVYSMLYKYLPQYGWEIAKDIQSADVVNFHIAAYEDVPINKPLVVSSHGMLWEGDGWGNIGKKVNEACLDAYMKADVVTAPSLFVANAIARHTMIKPLVVRHGIDFKEWQPLPFSRDYVLWNKARVDIVNDPGIVNLLAKLRPDINFVTTFGEKASNVLVTGKIEPDEMKHVVAEAGVYLASIQESGAPCFGVLEAMACGIPVVSLKYGGTAEIIQHKITGYLAKNPQEIIEGIDYCIAHRYELAKNALEIASRHFSIENSIQGYIAAYQRAIDLNNSYQKDVSIVIPCHNLDRFVGRAIQSALNQTHESIEVIVVNDASTDQSQEIIDSFGDKIKTIHLRQNQHVSEARNIGVQHATGRYILPLDADDGLYPNAAKDMVEALSNRNYWIAYGKLYLVGEEDLSKGFETGWPNGAEYEKQIAGFNRLPYSSMYRKQMWINLGGYRRRIRRGVEDADFWTRALSFGYKAAYTHSFTLNYTQRISSLGKINPDGSKAWLQWFGWSRNPEITPYGSGAARGPDSFDPPQITYIIPVGPGHESYIQTCLDSLLAQTESYWEAIVINDTGKRWFNGKKNHYYFNGTSFARIIDGNVNHGVAWARNRGLELARADRVVFLDVDDIALPYSTRLLAEMQRQIGGWIYGDWYHYDGNTATYSEAQDWSVDGIRRKMLGPITACYPTQDARDVGGFTEDAPGWEDWDFQLKLLEHGVCGTRIQYPIITYNMHLGNRRESNFADAENLLKYIKSRYGDKNMGCSKCGGKNTVIIRPAISEGMGAMELEGMTVLVYTGQRKQKHTYKSKTVRGAQPYSIRWNTPFAAFDSDVPSFLEIPGFHVYEAPPKPEAIEEPEPLLTEQLPVVKTIDQSALDEKTADILSKAGFVTLDDIKKATDDELLNVKGIGQVRLKAIRNVV